MRRTKKQLFTCKITCLNCGTIFGVAHTYFDKNKLIAAASKHATEFLHRLEIKTTETITGKEIHRSEVDQLDKIECLARDNCETAINMLGQIMADKTNSVEVRVVAASEILDRAWGKPPVKKEV